MKETMEAIRQMNLQTVLIYPNSDAGGKDIISVIKKYKYLKSLKTYKNVPREDYLGLLRISNALIGNSSSGIIEAPSFHLPVVNIGIRQEGRESSTNIINVQPRKKEILRAIKKALYDKKFIAKVQNSKNPYGNGTAGIKIANILSKIIINKKLIEKKITY
jgi:UDP-hydrolysing UDP-N-acetyl-D-glucosamine 2-epimerase